MKQQPEKVMKRKYKGNHKYPVCGACGKHLRAKHVIFELRYDDIGATVKNHQCACGNFTAVVVMDDESKNVNYVMRKMRY